MYFTNITEIQIINDNNKTNERTNIQSIEWIFFYTESSLHSCGCCCCCCFWWWCWWLNIWSGFILGMITFIFKSISIVVICCCCCCCCWSLTSFSLSSSLHCRCRLRWRWWCFWWNFESCIKRKRWWWCFCCCFEWRRDELLVVDDEDDELWCCVACFNRRGFVNIPRLVLKRALLWNQTKKKKWIKNWKNSSENSLHTGWIDWVQHTYRWTWLP